MHVLGYTLHCSLNCALYGEGLNLSQQIMKSIFLAWKLFISFKRLQLNCETQAQYMIDIYFFIIVLFTGYITNAHPIYYYKIQTITFNCYTNVLVTISTVLAKYTFIYS